LINGFAEIAAGFFRQRSMALTTLRNDALTPSNDLAQARAAFNEATRLLDGGLWDTPADSDSQIAYLGMYTTDIHAVLNDINGIPANPSGVTVRGAALNMADAVARDVHMFAKLPLGGDISPP
jgi:hypothetical protein